MTPSVSTGLGTMPQKDSNSGPFDSGLTTASATGDTSLKPDDDSSHPKFFHLPLDALSADNPGLEEGIRSVQDPRTFLAPAPADFTHHHDDGRKDSSSF